MSAARIFRPLNSRHKTNAAAPPCCMKLSPMQSAGRIIFALQDGAASARWRVRECCRDPRSRRIELHRPRTLIAYVYNYQNNTDSFIHRLVF